MTKLRCLIIDDDELSRNVIADLIQDSNQLDLVQSCENAISGLNYLHDNEVDLIFLDIEMPKMSGMEFIENLVHRPQVILITSHAEYALKSYEYNVTDFIQKPVSYTRFFKAVAKAIDNFQTENAKTQIQQEHLFIKSDSKLVKIKLNEIQFIEALGNYVIVRTDHSKYTVHTTMKELLEKLSEAEFARVHRSYIVRIDKIESIEDNIIRIDDKLITIGGVYKDNLLQKLNLL